MDRQLEVNRYTNNPQALIFWRFELSKKFTDDTCDDVMAALLVRM